MTVQPIPLAHPDPIAPVIALPEAPPEDEALVGRVLRDGRGITAEILADQEPELLIPRLLATAAGAGAVFGLAIGLPGGLDQALASAVKFPLVLIGAAGVSLPALRFACALSGQRLRAAQISALLLQSLATAATSMAALAPLAVVVWLTASTFSDSDYYVYRRAVAAFTVVAGLGGLVGASRLYRALPVLTVTPWAVLFGAAGMQLTWIIRPVVGQPGADFTLLRPLMSNAMAEVLVLLGRVL